MRCQMLVHSKCLKSPAASFSRQNYKLIKRNNYFTSKKFALVLYFSSWFLKLPVKLSVFENSQLICPLASEAIRSDELMCDSQSSCFHQTSLLYPNLKFRPPERHVFPLFRKKSILKQTLRRWTNVRYGSRNALWVTELIIKNVHFFNAGDRKIAKPITN